MTRALCILSLLFLSLPAFCQPLFKGGVIVTAAGETNLSVPANTAVLGTDANGKVIVGSGGGTGNVTGPSSSGAGNIPVFASSTGKALADSNINTNQLLNASSLGGSQNVRTDVNTNLIGVNTTGPTNIFNISTNAVYFDCSLIQAMQLSLETNANLIFTNVSYLTNYHDQSVRLYRWEDTNGTWGFNSVKVAGGLLRTNSAAVPGTNASQYDEMVARLDGTGTNLLVNWNTNWMPGVSFTNCLYCGGGGGGGGGYSLVSHTIATSTSTSVTTSGINTTGANLFVVCVTYYSGTPGVTDSQGNSYSATTPEYSDGGSDAFSVVYYCTAPTTSSSTTFTLTAAGGGFVGASVSTWTKSGGSPALDTSTGLNITTGNQNTSFSAGSITPAGNNELGIIGATWQSGTMTGIGSSYTVLDQAAINGSISGGDGYLIQSTATTENPTVSFSTTINQGGITHVYFK